MFVFKGVLIGLGLLVLCMWWQGFRYPGGFHVTLNGRLLQLMLGIAIGAFVPYIAMFLVVKRLFHR